jgi:hypothetical protein
VIFTAFLPAISKQALKRLSRTVRSWRLYKRTGNGAADLARMINPVVRGWVSYYGRFYHSALSQLLHRINTYLLGWIMQKYRGPVETSRAPHGVRLRPAARVFRSLELGNPGRGQDQNDKSRMTGDCHVRICGSPGDSREFSRTEGLSAGTRGSDALIAVGIRGFRA